MSGKKRWQPPHPDPDKQPRKYVPDPDSESLVDKLILKAQTNLRQTCAWEGCPKYISLYLNLPICDAHAKITHREVEAVKRLSDASVARQVAEHKAALEENTEKIEAGQRVTTGPIPGWVYYIQVDDTIKIGYAKDVTNRMRAYPPSAKLLAVEPGTKKTERDRHSHFNAYLAHGREWFRDAPELREWITTLRTEYGNPSHMAYTYTTPQSGKQVTVPRSWRGSRRTAA